MRYERHLPHWRQDGATYFVTFNLDDALPAKKQREIQAIREEWERKHPPPRTEACWIEYAKTVFEFTEKTLDAGFGRCWFQQSRYANELQRYLLRFHQERYELGCFAIMINHCQLTMRPFDGFELEDEIGAIKRATARVINEQEPLSDSLWQRECDDRIVRDEEHLYRVVHYIKNIQPRGRCATRTVASFGESRMGNCWLGVQLVGWDHLSRPFNFFFHPSNGKTGRGTNVPKLRHRLPNRQLTGYGSKNSEKTARILGNRVKNRLWHGCCITQERLGRAATLT